MVVVGQQNVQQEQANFLNKTRIINHAPLPEQSQIGSYSRFPTS
ncbi:MAG: hypothetical protein Q9P01_02620 [Anaerolineae bacterium]|nr:hypothetical protein [Anaerolineae bacterium]